MTAFEIHLNGQEKCVAGLNEAGVVVSAITWVRGKNGEDLSFRVGGLVSRTKKHVHWLQRPLKAGDEVRIVVVEKARADRPKVNRSESKAARQKRERESIEKKAAEFGWKIIKE